jgi:hypothetical protein
VDDGRVDRLFRWQKPIQRIGPDPPPKGYLSGSDQCGNNGSGNGNGIGAWPASDPHLCIDPRHEMLNTQSMRITSIITILPLTLKKHSTSIYGTRAVRRLPEEYLQYVRVARAFVSTLAQVPE